MAHLWIIFPWKPPFMVGIFHGYVSHNKMVDGSGRIPMLQPDPPGTNLGTSAPVVLDQKRVRSSQFCHLGLSENKVYSQWNSHLIGIMIINRWV